MSENQKIDLEDNSKYRVAFEMAKWIWQAEGKIFSDTTREYWLRLFDQCLAVINDYEIEEIINRVPKS